MVHISFFSVLFDDEQGNDAFVDFWCVLPVVPDDNTDTWIDQTGGTIIAGNCQLTFLSGQRLPGDFTLMPFFTP